MLLRRFYYFALSLSLYRFNQTSGIFFRFSAAMFQLPLNRQARSARPTESKQWSVDVKCRN